MKKNGYTLIELLAVITLLSVIAITTTPLVLGTINDSRRKAFESSVQGLARAISNAQSDANYQKMTYTIQNGNVVDSNGKKLEISVKEKINGTAVIDEAGRVTIRVNNGNWCGKTDANYDIQIIKYKSGAC